MSVGYSIALEYKAVSLESPDSPPITLSTSLQHPTLKEGEVTNGTFSLSLFSHSLIMVYKSSPSFPSPLHSDSSPSLLSPLPLLSLLSPHLSPVNVVITNTENAVQGMVVAIVGLPAALEPRFEYLQQLVKDKKIDYFEIFGREVILYLL